MNFKLQTLNLKGNALFFAISISLIIALISGSFILFGFFNRVESDTYEVVGKVQRNLDSGVELLLSENTPVKLGEVQEIDLFGLGGDEVKLTRKQWGLFEIAEVSGKGTRYESSKVMMLGLEQEVKDRVGLFIPDQKRGLSLAGKTVVRGKCYLPTAGVERAYIEGQSFSGSKLISGRMMPPQKSLPKIEEHLINSNIDFLKGKVESDSLVHHLDVIGQDITHGFSDSTLYIFSEDHIVVTEQLSGNIVMRSSKGITIAANADISDVRFYAPDIIIKSGFEGVGQFYASDSMAVEKNVRLGYPSVLSLLPDDKKSGAFTLEKNSEMNGVILVKGGGRQTSKISIEKGAKVMGQCYFSSNIDLKGDIYGSLYCAGFTLKTASSVYSNHLLNVIIDPHELTPLYAGIKIGDETGKRTLIKWLKS